MSQPIKSTNRTLVERKPRYEVRAANGTFQVFDTFRYEAIDSNPHKAAAEAVCRGYNTVDAEKRRQP